MPADRGFLLPISGGSNLLAVYSANASAVVLAFGGTNETLANVTASNPLESDAFYKGAFSDQGNGSVDPFLADPFYGRIGGGYDGLYRVSRRHLGQTPHSKANLGKWTAVCKQWCTAGAQALCRQCRCAAGTAVTEINCAAWLSSSWPSAAAYLGKNCPRTCQAMTM